jgi:hypothetical protein
MESPHVTKKKITKKKATKKPKLAVVPSPPSEDDGKPKRSKSAIGRQARALGHIFERRMVKAVRRRFPDRHWTQLVRRTDQSHRAHLPDVHGVPGLWPECQTAENITPEAKLKQATRDAREYGRAHAKAPPIAVALVRRKGSKHVTATMDAIDLHWMLTRMIEQGHELDIPVTLALDDFLAIYDFGKVDEGNTTTPLPSTPQPADDEEDTDEEEGDDE